MKLIGIEINRTGVRIPFTNIRIPIPYVVTGLISLFGVREVSANKNECLTPNGDFRGSCRDISVVPYYSVDPFVPPACEFTANCLTMFSGLPAVPNRAFIPANVRLENVSNNNGTLSHGDKPLSGKISHPDNTNSENAKVNSENHCLPPQGSYHITCKVQKQPYVSTDPNLSNTDLCKVDSDCQTLSGSSLSNMIYFNIKAQELNQGPSSIHKVENCNGKLTFGADDTRCQTKDPEKIKRIANEEGASVLKI